MEYCIDYSFENKKLSLKPVEGEDSDGEEYYEIITASIDSIPLKTEDLENMIRKAYTMTMKFETPTKKGIKLATLPKGQCSPTSITSSITEVSEGKQFYKKETVMQLRNLLFSMKSNSFSTISTRISAETISSPPSQPKEEEHIPILISIEGNIGAGKSTILKALKEKHPEWTFIDEPVDTWTSLKNEKGESLLELFYHDQRRWAYTFQNCAVLSRYQLIEGAIATTQATKQYPGKHIYLTERSLETDYNVFAKMLHDDGKIDALEFSLYEKWYRELQKKSTPLHSIVLVNTIPTTCVERIKGRHREGEEGIPLAYLENLNAYQNKWLDNIHIPVLKTASVEEIEEFVEKQLK